MLSKLKNSCKNDTLEIQIEFDDKLSKKNV